MFNNNVITLRAMEPSDIAPMYRWENDTSLWSLSRASRPFSHEVLRELLNHAGFDVFTAGQLRLIITLTSTGEAIGCIDLFDVDALNRRGGVGILIYAPEHRGHGYALEALSLLERYVFDHLDFRQLYADVPLSNEGSLGLFRKAGFAESGRRKEWVRVAGDNYEDAIFFQKLKA